ncbi:hypothetical protein [Agreia sp. VKM Ac-1783]|uniref:hypothetical protein n=1 Tax=Agreia sp. VKM Ac-1783 TaxID=1938889 RepID=UPI000A2AB4C8|nr:hypothetical protein [Agreia sp. VKM Ac-1783]SMQ58425.1 hypothetical protein SAMN06295943_0170 [Agreia sp. VKM Ac-1783]
MGEVYLDFESDKVAVIVRNDAAGQPQRVATVYLMKDGWHAKSAMLHTRHAWTGPFATADEALATFALAVRA